MPIDREPTESEIEGLATYWGRVIGTYLVRFIFAATMILLTTFIFKVTGIERDFGMGIIVGWILCETMASSAKK